MQVLTGCCGLWSCNEILTVRPSLLPWAKDMVELLELFTISPYLLSCPTHDACIKGRIGGTVLILHLNIFLFLVIL